MSKTIKIIHLADIKRKFNFPLQVKNIGNVIVKRDKYDGCHQNNIEFCLRLKSSEIYAVDYIGTEECKSTFPHLFVKQPNVQHKYNYQGMREAFFIIYPKSAQAELEKLGISTKIISLEFKYDSKIGSLLNQLNQLMLESDVTGVADEIDFLALSLLITVFNSQKSNTNNRVLYEEEQRIQKISSYLKIHYCEDLDMKLVAKKFGFSLRNFYRLWKKYFNKTPAQYIMELKISEACYLLENHSLSINEIANRLNFSDTAYFIVIFKRHKLVTPLNYRKNFLI